jgi:hypothetical protein
MPTIRCRYSGSTLSCRAWRWYPRRRAIVDLNADIGEIFDAARDPNAALQSP